MTTPKGLGPSGRALWKRIVDAVHDLYELDEREQEILRLACRQADDLVALEGAIKRDGRTVKGSAGQPRLHPAVAEARQARLAIGRLLGLLELPAGDDDEPRTERSRRAAHAANVRWDLADVREGRDRGKT